MCPLFTISVDLIYHSTPGVHGITHLNECLVHAQNWVKQKKQNVKTILEKVPYEYGMSSHFHCCKKRYQNVPRVPTFVCVVVNMQPTILFLFMLIVTDFFT
jgi:hypothetical protein